MGNRLLVARWDGEGGIPVRRPTRGSYGSQSRSAREDPQGRHDDDDGDRTGAAEAFFRRVIESCADGTIIVVIMKLCNFLSCIRVLGNSCFCGSPEISQQVKGR